MKIKISSTIYKDLNDQPRPVPQFLTLGLLGAHVSPKGADAFLPQDLHPCCPGPDCSVPIPPSSFPLAQQSSEAPRETAFHCNTPQVHSRYTWHGILLH